MPTTTIKLLFISGLMLISACSRMQVVPDDGNTAASDGGLVQPVVIQPGYPSEIETYPGTTTSSRGSHVVQKGEGLYSIGYLYGIDYKDIAAWNNIPPPYTVYPGQRLTLLGQPNAGRTAPTAQPQPMPTPVSNSGTYHTVQSGETLYRIAKIYNTTFQQIASLNNIPPPHGISVGQRLLVASGSTNTYTPAPSYTPPAPAVYNPPVQSNDGYQYHTVQSGETLYRIATLYGQHYLDVAQWNQLNQPFSLTAGQRLLVSPPNGSNNSQPMNPVAVAVSTMPVNSSAQFHIVERGETIYQISERYGIPVRDIAQWNQVPSPYILAIGQRLSLTPHYQAASYGMQQMQMIEPSRNYHIVKAGETLYGIAKKYRLTTQQLAAWSGLTPPYIVRPGQELLIMTR